MRQACDTQSDKSNRKEITFTDARLLIYEDWSDNNKNRIKEKNKPRVKRVGIKLVAYCI